MIAESQHRSASLHETAELNGSCHSLHADLERGLAVCDLLLHAPVLNFVVGPKHGFLEFFVYSALFPVKLLQVLGPLEVGHDHPAGVDQYVWQHGDSAVAQDAVCPWG
jgi:hypothetical protein